MISYELVNVSRDNTCPLQYRLCINADCNIAYFLRKNIPLYLCDKDSTIVVETVVISNGLILSNNIAGTGNSLRFSYLYNVTPDCNCDFVFKGGVCGCCPEACELLKCTLPTCLVSNDRSLTLKFFQYSNYERGAQACCSPCLANNCGCNNRCYNNCGCNNGCYNNCGCCNDGCFLLGGLAILALCFC